MSHQEALTKFVAAFVDELARSGIHDVVISPGSRSTPLAMLMAKHPDLKVWLNIDERSAGFFALGIAKARRLPVALVCTSGTAAANYYPAVVEAHYARVPLIVITADRPHELRDVGAPQAIDQIKLYGNYVKWAHDMPIPEASEPLIRYVRTTAGRAAVTSLSEPSGPIHLNFPFREPLVPDLSMGNLWDYGREHSESMSKIDVKEGLLNLTEKDFSQLTEVLSGTDRGLIVVGPQSDPSLGKAVTELAEKLRFPVLADPLSQLRTGKHSKDWIIDGYDAFLRDETFVKAYKPELIIRFGAMPVSKPFLLYLNQLSSCRYIVVEEAGSWREPTHLATDMIRANPVLLCETIGEALSIHKREQFSSNWGNMWRRVNEMTTQTINQCLDTEPLFEGCVLSQLQSCMSKKGTIFVGNSMPVRDLDTFFLNQNSEIITMANRGANGIDGVVSTALGVSITNQPVYLVIGDLSFFHDMNGLLAAKLFQLNLTVIVINNDGGGIFSFLPQAKESDQFEQLFGTPTGLDFNHTAQLYEGSYTKVETWSDFQETCIAGEEKKGWKLIEVPTDRKQNVDRHRQIWREVSFSIKSILDEDSNGMNLDAH